MRARTAPRQSSDTWMIVSDASPVADALVEKLRGHGERVLVVQPGAVSTDNVPRGGACIQAVVFGADEPNLPAKPAFTWRVTHGKAPLRNARLTDTMWSAARLAQPLADMCLVDLDPAQTVEIQAECLATTLRHYDGQSAIVFRGDQRFVPPPAEPATRSGGEAAKPTGLTRAELEAALCRASRSPGEAPGSRVCDDCRARPDSCRHGTALANARPRFADGNPVPQSARGQPWCHALHRGLPEGTQPRANSRAYAAGHRRPHGYCSGVDTGCFARCLRKRGGREPR